MAHIILLPLPEVKVKEDLKKHRRPCCLISYNLGGNQIRRLSIIFNFKGGARHVTLEQCAVQIDEMQGAAERRVPEADDPAVGRRCRATQQIGYLHKQCSALHVKDHPKLELLE